MYNISSRHVLRVQVAIWLDGCMYCVHKYTIIVPIQMVFEVYTRYV